MKFDVFYLYDIDTCQMLTKVKKIDMSVGDTFRFDKVYKVVFVGEPHNRGNETFSFVLGKAI